MEAYIQSFIKYLTYEKRYSEQTIRAYFNDLKEFNTFLISSGENRLESLEYQDIRLYLAHLNERQLARTTIARKLSSLRAFFRYAVENNWLEQNPMELIQYNVKKQHLPNFFYQDEMNAIFDAIENSNSPMQPLYSSLVELLYATGIRVSELCNLTLDQIDSSVNLIRVVGKGQKERIVPVGDVAMERLATYIHGLRSEIIRDKLAGESYPYVFITKTGKQLSPTTVRNILKKIIAEAGLNVDIHPHKIRHTFATHLLNNGADMRSVQELLGHEDLSSTQIYTHVTKDRLRKAYLDAFPRAQRKTKEE